MDIYIYRWIYIYIYATPTPKDLPFLCVAEPEAEDMKIRLDLCCSCGHHGSIAIRRHDSKVPSFQA